MSEKNPVLPSDSDWARMTKVYEGLREKAISTNRPVMATGQIGRVEPVQGRASDLVFGHTARSKKLLLDMETSGMVPGAVPIMHVHDEVVAMVPVVHDIMPDFTIQFESEAARMAALERARGEGLDVQPRSHYCLAFRVPKDFVTAMVLRGLLARTRADWRSAGPECPGSHGPMSGFERSTPSLESWHCRIRPTCIRTIPKDGRQISVTEFQGLTYFSTRYCEEEKEEKYAKSALALLKKRNETMQAQREVRQEAKKVSFSDPLWGVSPIGRVSGITRLAEEMKKTFPEIANYMAHTDKAVKLSSSEQELRAKLLFGGTNFAELEVGMLTAIAKDGANAGAVAALEQLASHTLRLGKELEETKKRMRDQQEVAAQKNPYSEAVGRWRDDPHMAPILPADDDGKKFWDNELVRRVDKGLRFLAGLNLQDHSIAEQRERESIVRDMMALLEQNDTKLGRADRKEKKL